MKTNQNVNKPIYKLAVSAVLVALASGLSLIKPWEMPLGGSVTLGSMIPIILLAAMYGPKWGFIGSFVYSLIQFMFAVVLDGFFGWGLTGVSLVGCILFDYILPFSVLGVASLGRKKGYVGIIVFTAVAVALRFVCHFISGWIFLSAWSQWENIPLYSLCYNGAYMLPELIITVICVAFVFRSKQIRRLAEI